MLHHVGAVMTLGCSPVAVLAIRPVKKWETLHCCRGRCCPPQQVVKTRPMGPSKWEECCLFVSKLVHLDLVVRDPRGIPWKDHSHSVDLDSFQSYPEVREDAPKPAAPQLHLAPDPGLLVSAVVADDSAAAVAVAAVARNAPFSNHLDVAD